MRIAAAIDRGRLSSLTEATRCKLYTIEKGNLCAMEQTDLPPAGIFALLREKEAAVLICGPMTEDQRQQAGALGLTLFAERAGSPDERLLELLEQQLICGPDACPAGGGCGGCGGCI